ncbi:hypothetical protein [Megamonas hypermegale]|uniref:hypothetical protein n=1 Tax=Megamonas hypermegale TaxID=158847 RepID=UPI0026EB8397|nr:hypothetical protein [Megamonas hypermegale]
MQDKSVIFKTIEQYFCWYPVIKKEFMLTLDERRYDYKTGGTDGKALINDRTANQAIKEIEPPFVPKIYITVNNEKGGIYVKRVVNPFKWMQLFEWARKQAAKNKIQTAVFEGRYVRQELHTATASKNGISRQAYFDARAEILHMALAGACQLGLIKVM